MNTTLAASKIIREIKEKRNEYDILHPSNGRRWYIATGQNMNEFNAQYPQKSTYEFHYLIESKSILDEVLTNVLQEDGLTPAEIDKFLTGKATPVYLFNYCFNFK